MMKRNTSFVLSLLLFFQSISPAVAQSSVKNEMIQLQGCINDRFESINQELAKIEGYNEVMDSKARLMFTKSILDGLLFSYHSAQTERLHDAKFYTASTALALIGTVFSAHHTKQAKITLAALEQQHATLRLDGKQLAVLGGEEALLVQERKVKAFLRHTKMGGHVMLVLTGILGYFAFKSIGPWVRHEFQENNTEEDLYVLRNSSSEFEFYRALRSESSLITNLRQESLLACKYTDNEQLMSIIRALISSTEEEKQKAFQIIQQQADTLFKE